MTKVKEEAKTHINEKIEKTMKLRGNKNVIFIYYGGYGVKDELTFYNEELPVDQKEIDKSGDTFIQTTNDLHQDYLNIDKWLRSFEELPNTVVCAVIDASKKEIAIGCK